MNNSLNTITIPSTIDSHTVKGIKSIIITNLDNSHELYCGNIANISDINLCTPINAGEKFNIDFAPLSKSFTFVLASTNSINYQYNVLYAY